MIIGMVYKIKCYMVPGKTFLLFLPNRCVLLFINIYTFIFSLFCSFKKQSGAVMYSAMSDNSDAPQVWIQEVPHQTLQHPGVLQNDGGLAPARPDSC